VARVLARSYRTRKRGISNVKGDYAFARRDAPMAIAGGSRGDRKGLGNLARVRRRTMRGASCSKLSSRGGVVDCRTWLCRFGDKERQVALEIEEGDVGRGSRLAGPVGRHRAHDRRPSESLTD
jgi:hypothetical protein